MVHRLIPDEAGENADTLERVEGCSPDGIRAQWAGHPGFCGERSLASEGKLGNVGEVEQELKKLRDMVVQAGGNRPRILHTHFASLGAPDVVFEQEVPDLAALETQMTQLTGSPAFQQWSAHMSGLLT